MFRIRRFQFSAPPFRFLIDRLTKDDDFIACAKFVLGIDSKAFEQLAVDLRGVAPFLDYAALRERIVSHLGETEQSGEFADSIWQLSNIIRDAEEPISECEELFEKQVFDSLKKEIESEQDRRIAATRLLALAAAPSGFDRQYKAQQLANATGVELQGVQILCDVRPVYASDRTSIDGAIVLATLRLNLDELGTEKGVDIRLTGKQLHDLAEQAARAEAKILTLKRLLQEKGIALAKVSDSQEEDAAK